MRPASSSGQAELLSISSWIKGLPIEATAYLDPALPPSCLGREQKPPENATQKRKALGEIPLNASPMSSKKPKLQDVASPSSRDAEITTPIRTGRKRGRTDRADDADETPYAVLY
jgi:hypothetical protein